MYAMMQVQCKSENLVQILQYQIGAVAQGTRILGVVDQTPWRLQICECGAPFKAQQGSIPLRL